MRHFPNIVCGFLGAILLYGCGIPMSRREVNTDLFQSEKEFTLAMENARSYVGHDVQEVFDSIGVPRDRVERILPNAVQELLYPRSLFQPHTAAEFAAYEEEMAQYTGHAIPFRDIEKTSDLMIHQLHAVIHQEGFDHKVFFVCKGPNEKLYRIFIAFVPVHEREKVYIWDLLAGLAQGAISQGGKDAVKALGF